MPDLYVVILMLGLIGPSHEYEVIQMPFGTSMDQCKEKAKSRAYALSKEHMEISFRGMCTKPVMESYTT